jgi:N-formylglutamate amidohydrolase
MRFEELLVVIPHSGIIIPGEIPLDSLSDEFPEMMVNVDWYTHWLYDFRDMLSNAQLVFPYCSLILEANRDIENMEACIPIKDVVGKPIYLPGHEPDQGLRQLLCKKYLYAFHRSIRREIARGKTFMLDAHSTVTARGVADNQIELMNVQYSSLDREPTYFCPDVYIETYANELQKRLPEVKVTMNESEYKNVYGHVCGKYSTRITTKVEHRVPAILQETNQRLFMNEDRTPNIGVLERLRRTFAEALFEMGRKLQIAQ